MWSGEAIHEVRRQFVRELRGRGHRAEQFVQEQLGNGEAVCGVGGQVTERREAACQPKGPSEWGGPARDFGLRDSREEVCASDRVGVLKGSYP